MSDLRGVHNLTCNFVDVCGFAKKPFRKKLVASSLWNDLDKCKNNFESLKKLCKSYRADLLSEFNKQAFTIHISGFYCPDTNRVEIILIGKKDYNTFRFTKDAWNTFKFSFIQVLCHELVHMMQFSNRDFDWSERKVRFKKSDIQDVNDDRKYHSTHDELQAYAHCMWLEIFHQGLHDNIKASYTYNMLLDVFGGDENEPAIKKTLSYLNGWNRRYSKFIE